MKNKHRIALVLMASLGLFSFGTTHVHANHVNPKDAASFERSTDPLKALKHDHLKRTLKKDDVKQFKQDVQVVKSAHLHHLNGSKKKDHRSKLDVKPNQDSDNQDNVTENNDDHSKDHKKLNQRSVKHTDKTMQHKHHKDHKNVVHLDKNKRNIDGMNRFSHKRRHYLYKQIGGNTRDLGGYVTQNHKYRVATDRIIRSADLNDLTPSGLKALKKLHVNKVIDLRFYKGKDGVMGHPDPSELTSNNLKGTGIDYQLDPVYTHSESMDLSKYMKSHDEAGEYYYYGDLSVSKPEAIKTYRKVFKDLLNNQHGAILFHCNLGRDRTGVTSALILSALGVNRNVIYHDYLLTDHYHYHIAKQKPYSKQAAELQHFFMTIHKKYGSVNAYLSSEIGLNHSKLKKLRKMYLVPNK